MIHHTSLIKWKLRVTRPVHPLHCIVLAKWVLFFIYNVFKCNVFKVVLNVLTLNINEWRSNHPPPFLMKSWSVNSQDCLHCSKVVWFDVISSHWYSCRAKNYLMDVSWTLACVLLILHNFFIWDLSRAHAVWNMREGWRDDNKTCSKTCLSSWNSSNSSIVSYDDNIAQSCF